MIVLTLGNSYSRISGLSVKHEKELKNNLSYVVGGKNAYFSRFGPRKKSLVNKRGEYPSGLTYRVLRFLSFYELQYTIKDTRVKP